jgi:hypothetical protein
MGWLAKRFAPERVVDADDGAGWTDMRVAGGLPMDAGRSHAPTGVNQL